MTEEAQTGMCTLDDALFFRSPRLSEKPSSSSGTEMVTWAAEMGKVLSSVDALAFFLDAPDAKMSSISSVAAFFFSPATAAPDVDSVRSLPCAPAGAFFLCFFLRSHL